MSQDEIQRKLEQIALMEEKLRLKQGLPHAYGLPRYKWQKDYEDAKFEKKRLICAANQIGKSTIQICDRITIATSPELWPELWPEQFAVNPDTKPYSWYLYPNQDTVKTEFIEKWEPYYMPSGEFKEHPIYGWKETYENKVLKKVRFNTGYTIYFKTYNQNVQDLQSGTVFAIDCDEELPEHLLSELQARLFSSNGYFSMAFTATLGQEFWKNVIEGKGNQELWPDAWKRQISMYDCLEYHDGSKTPWTKDRIRGIEANCKSKAERDRRVYGRFVLDSGLKYAGFDRERNYRPFPQKDGKYFKGVPRGWSVYGGVDIGSGGKSGHPSAYTFISVNPEYTKLRIFRLRRLDKIETTAGDTYTYYKKSRGKLDMTAQAYDWASADFGNIAGSYESWEKAKKDHILGEMALNTAFKTGMMQIYYDPTDPEDESIKLVQELESLLEGANKKTAKDDLIDSTRYAITQIPIDWEEILNGENKPDDKPEVMSSAEERRKYGREGADFWEHKKEEDADKRHIEDEMSEWADLY